MGNSIKLVVTVGVMACLFYAVNESQRINAPSLVQGQDLAADLPEGERDLALPSLGVLDRQRVVEAASVDVPTHPSGFDHPPGAYYWRKSMTVNGRVVDLSGQIVAGIEVHARKYGARSNRDKLPAGKEAHTVTDGQGNFELTTPAPTTLHVQNPRFATVYAVNVFREELTHPAVLVVAPRVELKGIVVDESGAGVPNATLSLVIPKRLYDLPGNDLAQSELIQHSQRSDSHGRFQFEQMPDLRTSQLGICAPGYGEQRMEFPPGGDANMRIVLGRAKTGPEMVTGRVEFKSGDPAAGAWVSAGNLAVRCDGEGAFALDLAPGGHRHPEQADQILRLYAVVPGYQPGVATTPSVNQSKEQGERKPLLLVLGDPSLSIQGKVVDRTGAPISGLAVRVLEADRFGIIRNAQFGWSQRRTIEDMMGGGNTLTDSKGAFQLKGLLDREYRVEVLQRPSLLSMTSEPLAAGADRVKLVLDLDAAETLAGTVVDSRGIPIEGVTVSVSRKWPGSLEIGVQSVSDSEGHFKIQQVTPEPAFLRIEGAPVVTDLFYGLPEDADLQNLEVVVARRCAIQFDFGDWQERGDALMALDPFGEQVEMMYEQGNTIGVRPTVQLGQGYSDVFAISDRVSHIVVLNGVEELARYPILLTPGETLLLRL